MTRGGEPTALENAARVMRTGDATVALALAAISIAESLEVLVGQGERAIENLGDIDDQLSTISNTLQEWTGHRGLEVRVLD